MDQVSKIAAELLKKKEQIRENLLNVKKEKKIIRFYETNKPYGCFSNFSKHPIAIDNKVWPTVEHYFQAQKFVGTKHEEDIRLAKTAMQAAQIGREKTRPLRPDWETCKVQIMYRAVKAKIDQHEVVKDVLLSTGNCMLVEHTKKDSFWGDNGDGSGRNMLGVILMNIRNEMAGYRTEYFLPPWVIFPDEEPSSMFWNMGKGETYLNLYWDWLNELSPQALKEHKEYFKPPLGWDSYSYKEKKN